MDSFTRRKNSAYLWSGGEIKYGITLYLNINRVHVIADYRCEDRKKK